MDVQKLWRKALRTLAVTVFIGGMFHLTTITIAAILYRQPNLLNPADFLGIKTLIPGTESSTWFYFGSWIGLICFYLFVFRYEHIKSHRYISGAREFLASIGFSKNE